MRRTTFGPLVKYVRTASRRWLAWTGLSGAGLTVAGCGALAAVGGGLVVALLTGAFLGAIQATFAATARSYAFTEVGSVRCVFDEPAGGLIRLTHFIGRLPGFHMVIIDDSAGKILSRSQAAEPIQYATDVDIDFGTDPPTLTGTVTDADGTQQLPVTDLYPHIGPVSLAVSAMDADGNFEVRLAVDAEGAQGEQLTYGLVMRPQLGTAGLTLDGGVAVERVLTTADGQTIQIGGSGSMAADKQ